MFCVVMQRWESCRPRERRRHWSCCGCFPCDATHTSHFSSECGRYGRISLHMTRRTLRWQKDCVRRWSLVTRGSRRSLAWHSRSNSSEHTQFSDCGQHAEGRTSRSPVRSETSPVQRENRFEPQRVGDDHETCVGTIHGKRRVATHESNGVFVAGVFQWNNWDACGEKELERQGSVSGSSNE